MRRIVNVKQMKTMEARTINEIGVPSLCLMERAAAAVADEIDKGKSVMVFCGIGNNGADGLAIARLLFHKGNNVWVTVIGEPTKKTKENIIQEAILKQLGVAVVNDYTEPQADIYVDALFGIGLSRDVTGAYHDAISFINEQHQNGKKVISVDVPSGINSDNGKILGNAVVADKTVTFEWLKQGLILGQGPTHAGTVIVKSVGIFADTILNDAAFGYDAVDLQYLPNRSILGNKGTFGKVLCICGSADMAGAAILSAKAAFLAGCGMVKIISHSVNRSVVINELPEAMFEAYDDIKDSELDSAFEWCDVCLIGPGLSTSDTAIKLARYAFLNCSKTLIADADALNIISGDINILRKRSLAGYQTVLTPHPGEFSRLFKTNIKELTHQDIDFIRDAALGYSVILSAKDARTIVSDGRQIYINYSSTSALATAGSGDVYAGVIAAFACVFSSLFDATCYATLVHSLAGIDAAKDRGERSVIASDIVNSIGKVLKS